MSLTDLSSALWRLRELLAVLLLKLEEEPDAGGVELVLEQIRLTELARAVHSLDVAVRLGLPVDAGLAVLADHAPSPWDALLHQHRVAFLTVAAEIAAPAEPTTGGRAAARQTLRMVTESMREDVEDRRPAPTLW